MIRKISASLGLCLLVGAAVPGVGCGTSDPATGGGAGASSSAGSASGAGAPAQPGAGASSIAGASSGGASAGAGAPSGAGAPTGAGAPGAAGSAGAAMSMGGSSAGGASAGASSGGASHGGAPGAGGGGAGAPAGAGCDTPGLTWKTANKTNYTSYPEPGSDECVKYSGCLYEGLFEACNSKQSLDWVKTHNIVAAFPLGSLKLHDLCLKKGDKTIVVTVYDTCGDSDCDGCCTENKGNKDELIDVESFTDMRWGVADGAIQWADLGPTKAGGCN